MSNPIYYGQLQRRIAEERDDARNARIESGVLCPYCWRASLEITQLKIGRSVLKELVGVLVKLCLMK